MNFVHVVIIDPNGLEYEADIDEDSEEESLLIQIVEELNLGDPNDFEMFIDTFGLKDGSRLKISQKEPPRYIKNLQKRD